MLCSQGSRSWHIHIHTNTNTYTYAHTGALIGASGGWLCLVHRAVAHGTYTYIQPHAHTYTYIHTGALIGASGGAGYALFTGQSFMAHTVLATATGAGSGVFYMPLTVRINFMYIFMYRECHGGSHQSILHAFDSKNQLHVSMMYVCMHVCMYVFICISLFKHSLAGEYVLLHGHD
jgi:hypothetical protein